jgi:hypothetical protein
MWQGVMLYRSLTGLIDLRRMCNRAVSYGRLLAFSVATLSISACARMHLSDVTQFAIEPKLGEGPEVGATANSPQVEESEAERMAKLETQMAALGADVADLQKALAMLDQQVRPRPASVPVGAPETVLLPAMSYLYAQAPEPSKTARSLFFEAELGAFRSKQAAEDCWRRVAGEASMADLNPRFTITGAETRLTVGPLLSEAAVNAIKIEASAISGPCRGLAPVRAF